MTQRDAFSRPAAGAGHHAMHDLSLPLGQSESEADPGGHRHAIRVSVVVPTCGRAQLLQRCLASLAAQQFDCRHFEIIVIDDALQPAYSRATAGIVHAWISRSAGHGPAIRLLGPFDAQAAHGPAAARNRGWQAARGTVIAFTDDDTIPRADWLAAGMQAFAAQGSPATNGPDRQGDLPVDAVWGRITMPLHGPASDYELDAKGLEQAEFVTANCFCRRAVLARIEGCDERFRLAWREDADLYFRLLDAGVRILHVPTAVVIHPIRPARWGVSLSQQRKVLFDALLFKKHPRRYRQKIRSGPRWDYYVTVGALLLAGGAALAGHRSMALAASSVWLWMTLRFFLRRLAPAVKTPRHVLEMIVTSILIPPLAVFCRLVGAVRFRAALL